MANKKKTSDIRKKSNSKQSVKKRSSINTNSRVNINSRVNSKTKKNINSKVNSKKQHEIANTIKSFYEEKPAEKHSIIKSFIIFIVIVIIVFIGLFVGNIITNKKKYSGLKNTKIITLIDIERDFQIEDFVGKNDELSDFFLDINGYDNNQITHPKILRFDKKWNGYKYWIAYTPYPYGNAAKENPFIMGSNDLINFETPEGLKNPLDEPEDKDFKKVYNSDTHLVYIEETDTLECYWRYVNDKTNEVIVYKRTTQDGVNWTEKEEVLKADRRQEDYLSPAIIYKDNKYLVWFVDRDLKVKYTEYDCIEKKWGTPRELDIKYENSNLQSWHLDVIETDKGYEMILVAFLNFNDRSDMKLYYTKSIDNVSWSVAKTILSPKDKHGLYRSSLLYIKDTYYVFYSDIVEKKERGVGIAYGSDINHLNGLQSADTQKFIDYIKING